MKICYITTISTTIKAFILPVLAHLKENTDWELSVMCSEDPTLPALLPEGVRYIPVKMERGISLSGIGAMLKMIRIFRKEKFDLVQYSTPNAALYASIASWLAGVKIRLYHQMGLRYLGFTGISRFIFKTVERFSCCLSSRIECVSPSNLALGIAEGLFPAHKASVLHYGSSAGVDMQRFDHSRRELWRTQVRQDLNIPEDACVFGFAGRITKDKGINELISAFSTLEDQTIRLLLVGNPENADTLLAKAAQDCRVIYHEAVPDIERYFAAMDVLVLPSYREGFGNIVIEAEAMGLPVIVSDMPGPTDAMEEGETGLTVPVKDIGVLKIALQTLLDLKKREQMGTAGKAFVCERFDQQVLLNKILESRKSLLEE